MCPMAMPHAAAQRTPPHTTGWAVPVFRERQGPVGEGVGILRHVVRVLSSVETLMADQR